MTTITDNKTKFSIGDKVQSDIGEVEVRGVKAHEAPVVYTVRDSNGGVLNLDESQLYSLEEYELKQNQLQPQEMRVQAMAEHGLNKGGEIAGKEVEVNPGVPTVGYPHEKKVNDETGKEGVPLDVDLADDAKSSQQSAAGTTLAKGNLDDEGRMTIEETELPAGQTEQDAGTIVS